MLLGIFDHRGAVIEQRAAGAAAPQISPDGGPAFAIRANLANHNLDILAAMPVLVAASSPLRFFPAGGSSKAAAAISIPTTAPPVVIATLLVCHCVRHRWLGAVVVRKQALRSLQVVLYPVWAFTGGGAQQSSC